MGGEIRGDQIDTLEQQAGKFLIIGVGLPLSLPDGDRPVQLLREGGFVVPVGAFHEANVQWTLALVRPRDEIAEVGLAIAQIRLERDADGWPGRRRRTRARKSVGTS